LGTCRSLKSFSSRPIKILVSSLIYKNSSIFTIFGAFLGRDEVILPFKLIFITPQEYRNWYKIFNLNNQQEITILAIITFKIYIAITAIIYQLDCLRSIKSGKTTNLYPSKMKFGLPFYSLFYSSLSTQ